MRGTRAPAAIWTGVAIAAVAVFAVLLLGRAGASSMVKGVLLSETTWTSPDNAVGGLSGLDLDPDHLGFRAVADDGQLVTGRLKRDGSGRLAGVEILGTMRFLDNAFHPVQGFHADAEALRVLPDGSVLVSFEGYARVARFYPPDMKPRQLHVWDRFKPLWGNQGMESLAVLPDGRVMTVLERSDGQTYRTFLYRGGITWVDGPPLATDGRFHATDAQIGPDGRLYLLERRLSMIRGLKSRISVYSPTSDGYGPPETLVETGYEEFADLEGLSVWRREDGHLIATTVSDNNFAFGVPTIFAEFDIAP